MYTLKQRLENEYYIEVRYTRIRYPKDGASPYILKDNFGKKDLDPDNKRFVIDQLFKGKIEKCKELEYDGIQYKVDFVEGKVIRIWNPEKCEVYECKFITSYLNKIDEIIKISTDKKVYFRGQSSIQDWLPSLYRKTQWVESEYKLNLNVLSKHVDEFKDCKTTIEKLIKLKHYNQPSRLLDIVANPLMALYFAADNSGNTGLPGAVAAVFSDPRKEKYTLNSDTVLLLANLSNVDFSEYWCMNDKNKALHKNECGKNNDYFSELGHQCRVESGIDSYFDNLGKNETTSNSETSKCIIIRPEMNNPRIIQQQGLFLLCGFDYNQHLTLPLREYNSFFEDSNGKRVYFVFSTRTMKIIKQQLATYGINKSQVYFDLEKTIEYERENCL